MSSLALSSWNVESGKLQMHCDTEGAAVSCLVGPTELDPTIYVGSADGAIRLYDAGNGSCLHVFWCRDKSSERKQLDPPTSLIVCLPTQKRVPLRKGVVDLLECVMMCGHQHDPAETRLFLKSNIFLMVVTL